MYLCIYLHQWRGLLLLVSAVWLFSFVCVNLPKSHKHLHFCSSEEQVSHHHMLMLLGDCRCFLKSSTYFCITSHPPHFVSALLCPYVHLPPLKCSLILSLLVFGVFILCSSKPPPHYFHLIYSLLGPVSQKASACGWTTVPLFAVSLSSIPYVPFFKEQLAY